MAEKRFIDRHASDNTYLHRDFHCAMDQGIAYLGGLYGDEAVDTYLYRFAKDYYAPLIEKARQQGLSAIRAHIADVYSLEGVPENVRFAEAEGGLQVSVSACPAVAYMRSTGYEPSKWYVKTTSVVNTAIADALNIQFELLAYDEENGAAEYRFTPKGRML